MALSYNKGDVVLVARRACSHDDNNEKHNSQEDNNAKHDQYALCSIADMHTSTKLLRVVPQLSVTLVSSQAAAVASSTTRSSTSLSAKRTVIKCVSIVPHPSPQPTTTVQVADMMMMRGDTEEASTSLSCSSFDTLEVAAGEMEELIDRRRQLQDDVDGSKLRIEEINLYIQALGDHRKSKDNSKYPSSNTTTSIAKDNNNNGVDMQEERRRLAETVLRADREMLLCRAAMRTVKAQQWAQVRDAEENGTLPACARATLTAVATVLSTTMQELLHNTNKNDQRIASIANAAGVSPAAMRVTEAYCKQYAAPHTISPEMSLSMPLNRWLHAVVHSFHAHKDATDFGLINDNNSNNRNTSSDRNDDATVQDEALHKELQEHTEYVQMALEELDALDEVINEMMRAQHSKTNGCGGVGGSVGKPKTREDGPLGMSEADIATDAEDHKHYSMVPLDQVLAVFPQTDMAPYLAMAATAASSTGGTTSIELSPRVSKRIIHVVEESSHQSGLRSNAAGGGGTLSKRAMELPTSIAAAHPKSLAGGGGGGGGVPPLSLQSLKTGSNTTTTSNNNRGGPTRRGRASRAALKGKVERAISAPRLASPRHGRPLLTSQTADNTPLEAPLSRPPRQPATEAVNRRRTTTTTPKAATGSADASMSLSLSSPTAEMAELRRQLKEAIHANPKYAEVHLIKEELKATASELHRVQDERDRLLTERRTLLPLLRGGRRRGPSSDVEAAEAPFDSDNNNSDQRDAYFAQDVIDDLEEQLASAHQRITELQQQQQQLHGGGGGVSCSINKEEISSRSAAKRSSSSSTALSDDTAGAASFLLMKNNNDIRLHAFNDVNTVNSADDVVGSESSAMRKELELQKRANRTLSETLNSTLHDQHVAEQAVAELKRELETMWSRLVDTETRLTEEQERSASTLLTGYHTTTNTAMQSCEQTPLRRDQRSSAAAPYTPFAQQHHNIQINNNNSNSNTNNNNNTLSEYEKDEPYDIPRYSSADVVSSQVIVPPSPTPTAPASSSSLLPTFTHYQQQPVDQMTPIELRHAVGQLRREVDRLQSVELRLSTEMQAVKDKLKDERHRSRQARDVRLQMLTRLQEEVEVALTGHNTGLDTLPDVIERAREGSEVAQRRRSLSGGGTHFC